MIRQKLEHFLKKNMNLKGLELAFILFATLWSIQHWWPIKKYIFPVVISVESVNENLMSVNAPIYGLIFRFSENLLPEELCSFRDKFEEQMFFADIEDVSFSLWKKYDSSFQEMPLSQLMHRTRTNKEEAFQIAYDEGEKISKILSGFTVDVVFIPTMKNDFVSKPDVVDELLFTELIQAYVKGLESQNIMVCYKYKKEEAPFKQLEKCPFFITDAVQTEFDKKSLQQQATFYSWAKKKFSLTGITIGNIAKLEETASPWGNSDGPTPLNPILENGINVIALSLNNSMAFQWLVRQIYSINPKITQQFKITINSLKKQGYHVSHTKGQFC